MKNPIRLSTRGVSLIELLVGLVVAGMVLGGIYRVFIAQGKAYTVQDQVVEVQQNIRTAMEALLKDLRMAGYDNDSRSSKITVLSPVIRPLSDHAITLTYELDNTHQQTVAYWLDGNSRLVRQVTIAPDVGPAVTTQEVILENVDTLTFTYGIDRDLLNQEDGAIDFWSPAGSVRTDMRVVAVQVNLIAMPEQAQAGDDRFKGVTPRSLTSIVMMRNASILNACS
jgi:type IV pilus assembly protein PilW